MNDDGFEYASYVCEYSNDTSYNVLHFSNLDCYEYVANYFECFCAPILVTLDTIFCSLIDKLFHETNDNLGWIIPNFRLFEHFRFFFWTFALIYDLVYQKSADLNSTYRLSTNQDLAQWISAHSKREHPNTAKQNSFY